MLAPPTAVQVVALMQLIAERVVPDGLPRGSQSAPPSVVPRISEPDAKHVVSLMHEMPVSEVIPAGIDWGVHVAPPSFVQTMAGPGPKDDKPTAVQ